VPRRGDVWLVDLDPTQGHEQAGTRPALVVSAERFNRSRAGLVVVVPLTTRERGIPLHVTVEPPEGGVRTRSYAKVEDVRSISIDRLQRQWGSVERRTLEAVADRLRILLDL
jgi:mRNA interferase MazF